MYSDIKARAEGCGGGGSVLVVLCVCLFFMCVSLFFWHSAFSLQVENEEKQGKIARVKLVFQCVVLGGMQDVYLYIKT